MKLYFLIGLLLSLLVCGCGGTDYNYVDTREEKPGPGLLSGDDGVFTVYKKEKEPEQQQVQEKTVPQ